MQSVIERILEGNFNKDNHILDFSNPVIELRLNENDIYEGAFEIYGPENEFTQGIVSSSRLRMKCLVDEFSGSVSSIPFSFDARGMSDGDSFKGEFRIISNRGEYLIPYDITIGNLNIDTSLGDIRNLFHFTNLARTNWNEAVELFYSAKFEAILSGADHMHLSIYRTLVNCSNKEQGLEEFLLKIKKKQPVEFLVEESNVRVDNVLGELSKKIVINRNGWGYSTLSIETSDDFIVVEKDEVTDDDFMGNCARIAYSIIEDKLHEGRNYGKIILRNAYNEININVCVLKNPINRMIVEIERGNKHSTIDLMHYYEAFRCRQISAATWMQETGKIVDSLCEANQENLYYTLMHVQLLLTQERYNEARWILEQTHSDILNTSDDTLYCYYYYLTTLTNRESDNTDEIAQIISDIYDRNKENWRIGWLLLYISEEYAKSVEKRFSLLKSQFERGATSPVIYIEAYQVLLNNPTILSELGSFELQVLKYIGRKGLLTADIIEQFVYIFEKSRTYKKSMIPLFKECYRILPSENVLKAMCMLLINLGITSRWAFEWYDNAIKAGLKITRLYEYYMLSIDMEAIIEIPKIVLMYFSFESSLDNIHNSFLYAYVYRNKALFPELFESYKETIERFVSFEILKGNNNKYISYLYKNMITESMVTKELSKGIMNVIFMHRIVFKNKSIRKVILRYDNLISEYVYSVNGKDAYIPLYGNNYHIALEDESGNSYICDDEYEIERLMVPDKIAGYIMPYIEDEILFDMWVCEHGKDIGQISVSNAESMRHLSDSEIVELSTRKHIKQRLIKFYYDEDMMEKLDSLLESLSIEDIQGNSFAEILRILVVRGMFEKAYEWVVFTGGEKVEAKVIVRLCSRLLRDEAYNDGVCDVNMLALIHRAFQAGKYEESLLKYLIDYFNGTSRENKEIWKTAKDYGLNTAKLEKRILEQYLYTNAYIGNLASILRSYCEYEPDFNLVKAVLSQQSYDYFVCDKLFEDDFINVLQTLIDYDIEIPYVCKLAYTRFYSEYVEELDDKIRRTIAEYLREILSRGMFFSYFKEYAYKFTFMHRFLDKTFVEYRTKDNQSVNIHYMIEKMGASDGEYLKEEMKNMYHGIYVKMFVLFFGERMQYYIAEEDSENSQLTQSGTFTRSDMDERMTNSKYSMINDIAISRTLGDDGTMDNLLVEYYKYEYLLKTIFGMTE